jgi:SAM-dependent methyltransferase
MTLIKLRTTLYSSSSSAAAAAAAAVICCCAQVFQEIHRVLKPGGKAYMSFSNRCFPTKGEEQLSVGLACHVVCVQLY